jgi:hypothetical protein
MRFTTLETRRIRSLLPALVFLFVCLPVGIAGCGCPSALLSGELVAVDEELGVQPGFGGVEGVERVKWPFGYSVRRDGDVLVLTNIVGGVEAREGDHVELGGGEIADGVFGVCGQIKVGSAT